MTLEIGQKAPEFTLPRDGDGSISSSDFKGQNLVVYFYPKDSTPGCTTEAKDFTALIDDFNAANTAIVGISKDSVKRHDNFISKQKLKVILGADEDGAVCESFGVWQLKKFMGREYMGIVRATFLIDGDGVIQHIWPKVKVKGHAAEVLEKAKALA